MQFKGRELVWMLIPVAVLGGIGYMTRFRQGAVLTLPGAFEPYIKGWKFETPLPSEVAKGYDTKVVVELDARGWKPQWWDKGITSRGGMFTGKTVAVKDGKSTAWPQNVFRWTPWTGRNGKWEAEYLFSREKFAAKGQGELRLQDKVHLQQGSRTLIKGVWLDIPVLKAGEAFKKPVASTDPGFRLTQVQLRPATAAEAKSIAKTQAYFLKLDFKATGKKPPKNPLLFSGSLQVQDSRGKTSGLNGASQPRPQEGTGEMTQIETFDFNKSGLVPPLNIVGELSWDERWPLKVKVPLMDAKGKLLASPRGKPIFRVSKVNVTQAGTQGFAQGADTVVEIELVGLNPKLPPSEHWNWEAELNPRLVDGQGKTYRLLNYKGTRKPIPVELGTAISGSQFSHAVARYALALKDIPKSAGTLTFKNELTYDWSAPVPVSVVVRK